MAVIDGFAPKGKLRKGHDSAMHAAGHCSALIAYRACSNHLAAEQSGFRAYASILFEGLARLKHFSPAI